MPISRKRKGAKRKPVQEALHPEKSPAFNIRIDASRVIDLKSNPDFLNMVKLGRALNAVAFALTEVVNYKGDTSTVGKRQYHRSLLVLAGFLHQAIALTLTIKGPYLGNSDFEPLRTLILDGEHEQTRKHLKKIRNFTAFHLDEGFEMDVTRKTLAKIKPQSYILLSFDESAHVPIYFDFADNIDVAFLIDEFSSAGRVGLTGSDVFDSVTDYAYDFINACGNFQIALGEKINIRDYVY